MGFFDLFRKTTTKNDEVFGQVEYVRMKDSPTGGYYMSVGELIFKPLGQAVDITIYSNPDGPTIQQGAFYRLLEEKYADIVNSFTPQLFDKIKARKPEFIEKEFDALFSLWTIVIPNTDKVPYEWEMEYEPLTDNGTYFTVYFRDWAVDEIDTWED